MTTDFIIEIIQSPPALPADRWTQRKYALINEALDAYITNKGNDLKSNDERLILDCEAWVSSENVTLGSSGAGTRFFTTDATRYLWIRAKVGHRYDGNGAYPFTLRPAAGNCFQYDLNTGKSIDYLRVDGIRFDDSGGASIGFYHRPYVNSSAPIYIQRCIFNAYRGLFVYGGTNYGHSELVIGACLAFNCGLGAFVFGSRRDRYVINCQGYTGSSYVYYFYDGVSGAQNIRLVNTYGKRGVSNLSFNFIGSDQGVETNYNISGTTDAIADLYEPGSVPGSNESHTGRPTYRNLTGELQDGSKTDFRPDPTYTGAGIVREGEDVSALGGIYADALKYGHDGPLLDVIYNEWPVGASNLWNVGAFTIINHEVITTAGAGGSVSPLGTNRVEDGQPFSLNISPNIGYEIDQILLDGNPQAITNPFVIPSIITDHTVHVTFKKQVIVCNILNSSYGSPSPSGSVNVLYGDPLSIELNPDEGYQTRLILVNGVSYPIPNPTLIIPSVTSPLTIVIFYIYPYCRNLVSRPGIEGPQIVLTWDNPESVGGYPLNIRIVRKQATYPEHEDDGEIIYEGAFDVDKLSHVDNALSNMFGAESPIPLTGWYYKIFTEVY